MSSLWVGISLIAGPSLTFFGAARAFGVFGVGAALIFFVAAVTLAFLGAGVTLVFFVGGAVSSSSLSSSVLTSDLRFLEARGAGSAVLRLLVVAEFMLAFCKNSQDDVDSPCLGSAVFLGAVVLGAVFFGTGLVAVMDGSA